MNLSFFRTGLTRAGCRELVGTLFFKTGASLRTGFLLLLGLLWLNTGFAQEQLTGTILETDANGKEVPLPGVNLVWKDTTIGAFTDLDGNFKIDYKDAYRELVISYVGYETDTISVSSPNPIRHVMRESSSLREVVLEGRKNASATSFIQAENVLLVSSEELLKAACCNLSESFETNPSIDVNFADALTGTRQIRMLGLKSPYILITNENIPSVRGAAQTYGLSFIPGPWVESIQITKGAGSVVNGFESITGQINAELQKPTNDQSVFVNGYANLMGRLELNTHLNTEVSDKLSTGLYLHGDLRDIEFDRNNDGFLDVPLAQQLNIMNRWQYTDAEKGIVSFLNLRYMNDEKQVGQLDFRPDRDKFTTNLWGSEIDTERLDLTAKLGYVNPQITHRSLGVQVAYSYHDQQSYFGFNTYDIIHRSLYANAIYNSILFDTRHKFKSGISATYDQYDELVNADSFNRIENSIGGFFEYNYDNLGNLNMNVGIRIDHHNRLGTFLTPRLHVRYTPWSKSALRFSAGRGKRSANIFTENQQFFASSREYQILGQGGPIYGLNPEIAWNYGISFLQGFNLFGNAADITFDFYRTDFEQQVVVDWENPDLIRFYNLDGSSFANNFQVVMNYVPFKWADIRLAYKYFDVQTDYESGRLERPLTANHRFFVNGAYEYHNGSGRPWKFDVTYNWVGPQRFPSTSSNPQGFRLGDETPSVSTLSAQITKVFSKSFEFYIGGENINNFRQENPILGASDPFGSEFDTTFVYGPIFGSMYYAGFRFKIP